MVKFILLMSVFWSGLVYSDDVTVNFGTGVFNSGKDSLAETKVLYGGYNYYLHERTLFWRTEFGGWVDTAGSGRGSSAFGSQMLGVNAENEFFYAQGAAGVALLSNTDSFLGGNIAFTETASIGINGSHNTKVGVFYKHISNAGLYDPNIGRDFIGVQINIPLF